jgi:hypothetical protein
MDSLRIIWPENMKYDRVLLILSDQAFYMLKAMNNLILFFPNLHHVTCLAHALHRVCMKVAEENQEINSLISLFKSIMAKSPLREYQFQQKTGLSLPVKPALTRWGTWLSAAYYNAENYIKIRDFIMELPNSSKAIISAKNLIESQTLQNNLIEIRGMKFLTEALIELQTQGLKLSKQLKILDTVKGQLQGNCLVKLEKSLLKNPDLKKFTKEDNSYEFRCNIRFAPLVSVDVERSFSQYKDILSDKRQNMTKTTIEHLNIICFNDFLD